MSTHHPQVIARQPEANSNSDGKSCSMNPTMFQGFEWYCPADKKHWQRLAEAIPGLAALGITSMWIPPATKTAWRDNNGYAPYDLYDLGEFNQKGATSTKWGTKKGLLDLVDTATSHGVAIIFDAVLNHRGGADHAEAVVAVKVDPEGNDPAAHCMT